MRIIGWLYLILGAVALGATGYGIQYKDLPVPLVLTGGVLTGILMTNGMTILNRHPKKVKT